MPSSQTTVGQEVLKPPAVELVARAGSVAFAAQFQAIFDARIVAGRKEEPQAEFGQLFVQDMLFQPQDFAEVVGGDFDRRLAHFESRFGNRMFTFFQNRDPGIGQFLPALQVPAKVRQVRRPAR